ncbi:MAG: polysaccharide deacetylase family protein [Candidatus Omnitrophica bacterium]|nr:polysaccharide deacetylase family protein [Candidatus Omnitrophota bacterium]
MRRYRRFISLLAALIFVIAGFLWAREQYVVPIIMYHRIDEDAGVSRISVSPESFKRQMYFLKGHNYNVVRLEDLPELLSSGKIPRRTIAITFDDGYENNYTDAYPVLKELGLPATIFISPALIGTEGYLRWDQVIEMSESGVISIGSHAMTHAYLPALPEQRLDIEISDSKRAIEGHIRKEVPSFSYPVGAFNDYVRGKVRAAGYKIAVATNPGKHYPKHDLFAMKRLRISMTSDSLLVFWIETSGFYTWIKEHRDED